MKSLTPIMDIKCVDCSGTGRRQGIRCSTCRGSKITEIEPTEYLRLNRLRVGRNLPKLERA